MANAKGRRRRFGAVRQLPSGQWQARYRDPDGLMRPADTTFPTKTDAEIWLTRKEAEILDGDWINPDTGKVLLCDYATAWIEERPNLRPKTIVLYRYLLRGHIAPYFKAKTIAEIKEAHIRRWRKELLDSGTSTVTTAKAYRLLKAVLNTAVDDGIIRRNPCRIKGASAEKSPERPVLTVPQVFALAEAIDQRYGAFVLLAAFSSLRWGELTALRHKDIDPSVTVVRVARQLTELPGGGYQFGPPKSDAGHRLVPIPGLIAPSIRAYLDHSTDQSEDALVFTSPTGLPLRHGNFRRRFWLPALGAAGLPAIHFHDLRHTGNTLTADAGANLRELMERMGHSTTKAALVYLHSTSARQQAIADAISRRAEADMRQAKATGTGVAQPRDPASPEPKKPKAK
jgi:integrase